MVAAVSPWHSDHRAAAEEINARLSLGEEMSLAAPALVEAYSVLTRLPQPNRLTPADAWFELDASFVRGRPIEALAAEEYVALLRDAVENGIAGGRIYDAIIAACARKAGADTLLTFNERHFLPFAGDGPRIVVPGRGRP